MLNIFKVNNKDTKRSPLLNKQIELGFQNFKLGFQKNLRRSERFFLTLSEYTKLLSELLTYGILYPSAIAAYWLVSSPSLGPTNPMTPGSAPLYIVKKKAYFNCNKKCFPFVLTHYSPLLLFFNP